MAGGSSILARSALSWPLSFLWVVGLALVSSVANAGDKAMAESLFQQGKAAMTAGDYGRGCPLLEASLQEERAVGTMLNLALCHEKQGKTATAWAEFSQAAGMAERADQHERAHGARKYAADLERTLSTIAIIVTAPVPGLVVTRQGRTVSPATYGVPIAADPGTYTIEASAPEHPPWSATIELGARGDRQSVTVPSLGSSTGPADPQVPREPVTEDAPAPDSSPNPVVVTGVVVGSVGVVALGVGIALGAIAISDTDKLEEDCPDRSGCSPEVLSRRDTVATKANVATGTVIGGSAAVAAGLLMILLAPDGGDAESTDRASLRFVPQLAADRAGLRITGAF